MDATSIQSAWPTADWHLHIACDAPSRLSLSDPGIDDPVNDTGLGLRRGDLEFSDAFACLIRLICEGSGEFL